MMPSGIILTPAERAEMILGPSRKTGPESPDPPNIFPPDGQGPDNQ
jgi:hypothetical protein